MPNSNSHYNFSFRVIRDGVQSLPVNSPIDSKFVFPVPELDYNGMYLPIIDSPPSLHTTDSTYVKRQPTRSQKEHLPLTLRPPTSPQPTFERAPNDRPSRCIGLDPSSESEL